MMADQIEFIPAKRDGVGLFICLGGAGRTGKTVTALRLARGIAGKNGKILACDTEGRRMSHYSDQFQFDVFNMRSPFSPLRFLDVARRAQEAGAACLITDSFSLEWAGEGGVLDIYDREWAKRNRATNVKDICWSIAKEDHKRMFDGLTQLTLPIIFCCRAKTVPKHLTKGNFEGAMKVVTDANYFFEWTVALTLHPDTPGQPRYDLKFADGSPAFKVQQQHRAIFPPGQFITEAAGAALWTWAHSDGDTKRDEAPVLDLREGALKYQAPTADDPALVGDAPAADDPVADEVERFIARVDEIATAQALLLFVDEEPVRKWRDKLRAKRPELTERVDRAVKDRMELLKQGATP